VFKTSRNGKPVIEYDNYRFNLYKVTGPSGERRSWRCWRWRDGPCRASILTIADVIVKVGKTHNHPSLLVKYIVSKNGNPVMQYGSYRFSRHSDYKKGSENPKCRWICMRTHRGCRAAAYTFENKLIKIKNVHNH
ncbi:Uncharacterized protein OBRU01_24986, partial [Operophtera brumata]